MRNQMNRSAAAMLVSVLLAAPAAAQQRHRIFVGGLAGWHHESADWVDQGAFSGGALVGASLTRWLGVELTFSRPAETLTREYEGFSVSFAPPGASREDIERLAVFSRFRHERSVNSVISAGAYVGTTVHSRWTPSAFVGATVRSVEDRLTHTPLRYPDGLTPQQIASVPLSAERIRRTLGGPTVGADLGFALTKRVTLQPSVRYDVGSFADEINDSLRSSLRVLWMF